MWKSLSRAKTLKATLSPTFALRVGVLPGVGAAVDAGEVAVDSGRRAGLNEWKREVELAGGPRRAGPADQQRAEEALEDRQRVHRPVVVVEPGALGALARLPDVLEGALALDEAAGVGVPALVGAVHLLRVEDAVRVDRHRGSTWLRKLTTIASPVSASISGPGIVAGPSGAAKPAEYGAVGVGDELRLAPDLAVHHRVAAAGDDVPLHRLGLDPVLAPGPDAVDRQRRLPAPRRRAPRRRPSAAPATSLASRSTSAGSPANTFWPASVQSSRPPVPANSSRRPNGSGVMAVLSAALP